MGGCGTYSKGNTPKTFKYKSVGTIHGVKIIEPVDSNVRRKLPEESAKSKAYLLLDKNGVFHQYREYNKNHEVVLEIGYHIEQRIDPVKPWLHIHRHIIPGFKVSPNGEPLTSAEIEKYKKFFIGVPGYDK